MSSEPEYCTRVFWDVVDFPFPKGLSPETIYHRMKSILEKMGCINHYLSIMAYVGNSETFPDKSAYEKAGINIVTQRERHRFMLRDMAWWDADSDFLPNFGKITFMVILSQIEPSFLLLLEGLRSADYKVRLAVPDEDTSLSSSPKLLENTVRFDCLYKTLLLQTTTETVQDMMTMTREVVTLFYPPIQNSPPPLYYPPIQTTPPDEPNPQICISRCPGVFLDLPESLPFSRFYNPDYINSYVRSSMGFGGEFSIMAYVVDTETSSFPEGWVDAFTKFGITIIPQQADIRARAHKMSVDIVLWALDNTATYFQPRDLLVFSGNVKEGTDFYNALEALRDRYYNVNVLHPTHLEMCFPHPLMHHELSLDHWPKEEVVGFSHGVASLYKQNLKVCGVFVFWDVQGCPTDLSVILPALRKKGYCGKVLLIPYLDMDYQGDELFTYDGYACVPSIKVQGDKYTKVARMLLDILFWAMNHDNHARNLMFISQPSKDIDIVTQALERRFFNVIFKPSDEVAIDRFESLCKSPPHPNTQIPLKSPCRTLTDVSRQRKSCPVRIYWLVDTCPSKPYDIPNLFSSTLELKGYGGFESVTAYVEKGKTSDEVIKVCRKSGLQVILTPEGDEFGKFNLMVMDMINWTYSCAAPFNFLVISSKPFRDALCDSVFEDLKSRGCNVLFETVDYMVTFGTTLWSAKSLLDTAFSDSSQALA